MTEGYG